MCVALVPGTLYGVTSNLWHMVTIVTANLLNMGTDDTVGNCPEMGEPRPSGFDDASHLLIRGNFHWAFEIPAHIMRGGAFPAEGHILLWGPFRKDRSFSGNVQMWRKGLFISLRPNFLSSYNSPISQWWKVKSPHPTVRCNEQKMLWAEEEVR